MRQGTLAWTDACDVTQSLINLTFVQYYYYTTVPHYILHFTIKEK